MRIRSTLLAVMLVLALVVAGCGSSSSSSSSTHKHTKAKVAAGVAGAVVVHHAIKKHREHKAAGTAATYRAGEFCSAKKESVYKADHLKCVDGRLKKV